MQDAAYGALLREPRRRLHTRIAAVLASDFPETEMTAPEILAQHYTAAGAAAQAIPYWLKAGQNALQRSALAEAVSRLTKGLELLQSISDENARAELELGLQATLALALTAAKGYAAPEVEQAYSRARQLCDQIGDAPQLFPVLYGVFMFHWVRGHLPSARDGAEELLSIAASTGDFALLLIAHSALGNVSWHWGTIGSLSTTFTRHRLHMTKKARAARFYVRTGLSAQ